MKFEKSLADQLIHLSSNQQRTYPPRLPQCIQPCAYAPSSNVNAAAALAPALPPWLLRHFLRPFASRSHTPGTGCRSNTRFHWNPYIDVGDALSSMAWARGGLIATMLRRAAKWSIALAGAALGIWVPRLGGNAASNERYTVLALGVGAAEWCSALYPAWSLRAAEVTFRIRRFWCFCFWLALQAPQLARFY